MPTPKDIAAARHAIYLQNSSKWQYFADHFAGGVDYPGKQNPLARASVTSSQPVEGLNFYVVRHPLEDSANYLPRLYRAATVNLCASPISLVCGTVGQPDGVVIDLPNEYGVILDDADGMGNSLLQFMATARKHAAVFGHCFVLVDATKAQGPIVTQADVLRQGIRPILRLITPADMLAWRLDHFGQPLECLFRITRDSSQSILADPGNQEPEVEYRLWTREEWLSLNGVGDDLAIVDRGPNPLGVVPVTALYHARVAPWLGESLIKEASKFSQLATNWLSDLDAVTVQQSFSQLWLRSKDTPDKVGVGVSTCLHLKPTVKDLKTDIEIGQEEVGYVSPDSAPLQTQWDGLARIMDMANASMDLRPEATTDKTHQESGISRAWRWHATEKRLVQMALNEQEAVKSCMWLCAQWMGQTNFAGSVSYSSKYDLSATEDDITNMLALQAAGLPPTARRELMRAILLKTLPNLDAKAQNAINSELERIGATEQHINEMTQQAG